jgi:hypothetical protein
MAGGLINIVSYGAQDLYLSGDPEITFYKIAYRRHTNFSMESIEIEIEDGLKFGNKTEINLIPIGDAIHKGYLEITLPYIGFKRSDVGLTPNHPTEDELDSALSDYNIIKEFMKINTEAYIAGYENLNVENISTLTIIEHSLEQFRDTYVDSNSDIRSTKINNYNILLDSTDMSSSTYKLDKNLSNLNIILNNLRDRIIDGETITISELTKQLDFAIDNSIATQDFFFNKTLTDKNNFEDESSSYIKFAWVKRIGHAIIDNIDIRIGGESIDKHLGMWIDIWFELTGNHQQLDIYNKMIGDVTELTTFDRTPKPEYKLHIPLNFWFNRFNGLSFPIGSLQYSDFVIHVNLKNIERCCYIERLVDSNDNVLTVNLNDLWDDNGLQLNGKLLIDYIFMESNERKKFAQSAHEYLIETVQHNEFKNITKTKTRLSLDFKHPCKELIWVIQRDVYNINDNSYTKTYPNIYSTNKEGIGNPILTSFLDLNGYSRIEKQEYGYFNYLQSMKHTNTPADGVNVYSFGLNPEEHQPSGTCNFSIIPGVVLNIIVDSDIFTTKLSDTQPHIIPDSINDSNITTTITIHVFCFAYNILRIINGYCGKAYS